MRSRLPWLLLSLSLALNVFVVAGVVYSGNLLGGDPTSPSERLNQVVDRLGLNDEQRDQLIALRQRTITRREEMRANRGGYREVLVGSLEAPSYDRAAFLAQLSERSTARHAFFADTMAELHGYLAGLSPEQKAAFLELAKERGFLRRLLGKKRRN